MGYWPGPYPYATTQLADCPPADFVETLAREMVEPMRARTARRLDELFTVHGWPEALRKLAASRANEFEEAVDALWGVLDAERKLAAAREAAGVSE